MNENLNLVEILKDCPKGTKLYSSVFGMVELDHINIRTNYPIVIKLKGTEGYESLTSILFKKRKVNPENIFLLGCRDLDSGEIKLINDLEINMWTIEDIKNKGAKATIEELLERMNNKHLNNIHLSYDIDCLDPSYVPGTGTPVNNGLTFEESQVLLHGIFSTSHVKCIDFVEYNPELDNNEKTKETCLELLKLFSEEIGKY